MSETENFSPKPTEGTTPPTNYKDALQQAGVTSEVASGVANKLGIHIPLSVPPTLEKIASELKAARSSAPNPTPTEAAKVIDKTMASKSPAAPKPPTAPQGGK